MSDAAAVHPLDRSVWNTLNSGWASHAQGDADASRIDQHYGVFGAARDDSEAAQAALARLVPVGGELWFVEPDAMLKPPGCRVVRTARLLQMVHDGETFAPLHEKVALLGEGDAEEIAALVSLTRPGPFARYTHRLGRFVGIREKGSLIAISGERMALPSWREISAVCTHPDHRGRGLAAQLIGVTAGAIAARGEQAWLTSYADNHGAIALYERLGFTPRATMVATVLTRDD